MNNDPSSWNINIIQDLIDNKVKESINLEYKSCPALSKDRDPKMEVSKDVTAFANSEGGIIIYGVIDDKHLPIEIDEGYDPKIITKERLEQIIMDNIKPKIEGIIINQIEIGGKHDARVVYVVSIPKSERAPHQASNKKFYVRRNFISEAMDIDEIKNVILKAESPDVNLEFYFRRFKARIEKFRLDISNPETLHNLEINGVIKNEGGGEVNNVLLSIFFDARLSPKDDLGNLEFRPLKLHIGNEVIDVMKIDIKWVERSNIPLYNPVEYLLFQEDIRINFKVPWLNEKDSPFLIYEIDAPRMEPRRNLIRFRLEKNSVFLNSEELPDKIKITQDDRNRDFLGNPDMAIEP